MSRVLLLIMLLLTLAFAQAFDGGSLFLHGFARIENNGQSWYINRAGTHVFDKIIDSWNLPKEELDPSEIPAERILFMAQLQHKYGVFDEEGNWLLMPIYDSIDRRMNTIWKVSKEGKVSLCNTFGKLFLPLQYEDVSWLDGDLFAVKNKGKWGIYSIKLSKLIVDAIYEEVDYCGGCGYSPTYFLARKGDKWGVVDFKGKVLAPFEFDHEHYRMRSDEWVMSFSRNGNPLIYNLHVGNAFGEPIYTNASLLNNGFLAIKKADKYGLIAGDGTQILDFVYDGVEGIDEDIFSPINAYVSIKKAGLFGLADTTGSVIIEPKYKQALSLVLDRFFWADAEQVLFNAAGDTIFEAKAFNRMEVLAGVGMLAFRKAGKWWVFDPEVKKIITVKGYQKVSVLDGNLPKMLLVKQDGWYGAINGEGKEIVPASYDHINRTGLATLLAAKKGRSENLYTPHGQALLKEGYGYEELDFQDTTLFKYYKVGEAYEQYGLMDIKGTILCEDEYNAIYELGDQRYLLKKDDSLCTILDGKTSKIKPITFKTVNTVGQTGSLLVGDGKQIYLYNSAENKRGNDAYQQAEYLGADYIKVRKGENSGLINTKGRILIPIAYDDIMRLDTTDLFLLIKGQTNGAQQYGVMNAEGKLLLPVAYDYTDMLYNYKENGYLVLFKKDPNTYDYLKGLADLHGTILVEPNYQRIFPLKDRQGFLVVKNRKAALLDDKGAYIGQEPYDDVMIDSPAGLYTDHPVELTWPALVRAGDEYYYLNRDGKKLELTVKQVVSFAKESSY